jgi:hypothetical protein
MKQSHGSVLKNRGFGFSFGTFRNIYDGGDHKILVRIRTDFQLVNELCTSELRTKKMVDNQ